MVYAEVTMRQAHEMRMPVTMEVGKTHVRVTSVWNFTSYKKSRLSFRVIDTSSCHLSLLDLQVDRDHFSC